MTRSGRRPRVPPGDRSSARRPTAVGQSSTASWTRPPPTARPTPRSNASPSGWRPVSPARTTSVTVCPVTACESTSTGPRTASRTARTPPSATPLARTSSRRSGAVPARCRTTPRRCGSWPRAATRSRTSSRRCGRPT